MLGKPEARLNTQSIEVSNSRNSTKKSTKIAHVLHMWNGESVHVELEAGKKEQGGEEVAKSWKKLRVISIPLEQKKNARKKGENVAKYARTRANNLDRQVYVNSAATSLIDLSSLYYPLW